MKRAIALIAMFLSAAAIAVPLIAQESEEAQKSALLEFVEDRLSTPERQIDINGLEGVISQDVSASSITFSDEEGVWFRIDGVQLNWNQGALLTGRLQINSLTAESITYTRNPEPAEGFDPPAPEAASLEIPEFPVAIFIDELSVPSVSFGEAVFGLDSEISVDGSLALEGGSLDTDLTIERLDETGGSLVLDAQYSAGDRTLDLDLELAEPENGVLVNLLQIEDRPDIRFTVTGSGELEDLAVDLLFEAGGTPALEGRGTLTRTADSFVVDADLGGPIAGLMAQPYRPLFGESTDLSANATLADSGAVTLENLTISGGQLQLTANARTSDDRFLTGLDLTGEIADPAGGRVTLPVTGADTTIGEAAFMIDYDGDAEWTGQIEIVGFENAGFGAQTIRLDAGGAAMNLDDPQNRRVTFNADGAVSGITADDPEVVNAFGTELGIGFAGLWEAGSPLNLAEARIAGKSFETVLAGEIENFTFDGDVSVTTTSITPFSGLAGRDLAGSIELAANGTLAPITGAFDLRLDGEANGLTIGVPAIDGLLSDQTSLSGRVGRGPDGVTADDFRIASDNTEITADGRFSSTNANFDFGVTVEELNRLDDNVAGRLTATGSANGAEGDIDLDFTAQIPSGRLTDRTLQDARLAFAGNLNDEVLTGNIEGDAFLGPHRVQLASGLRVAEGINELSDLEFRAGATTLAGNLIQDAEGLVAGGLRLDSNDVSTAAALALIEASGAANGSIDLAHEDGVQSAELDLSVRDFEALDAGIDRADIAATVGDLFGVPVIEGNIDAAGVTAAGIEARTLTATARSNGETTDFTADAALATGTDLAVAGDLAPAGGGYRLGLQTLSLDQDGISATLARPANLTVGEDSVQFDGIEMSVGGGRISASGTTGEALDIDVDLEALPLSIANAVQPGLGLAGTVSGSARVGGSASAPEVSFDIAGSGLDASAISGFGIGPVALNARGTYADRTVRIASASAEGRGGLSATASGPVVLEGSGSNLSIAGTAPLSFATSFVGQRGTQLSGTARLDAQLTGSLANPRLSGTVSTAGAEIVDPQTSVRLTDVGLQANLSTDRIAISRFSANLAGGGSLDGRGTVTLGGSLPADISIDLNSARYADGSLFAATASGNLALTGPLLDNPTLSGRISIEEANIAIPDFGSSTIDYAEVRHVAIPPDVARTLYLARRTGGGGSGASGAVNLDVRVEAPNQIFIRGDGVEAEVGGSVRLTGTTANIEPVGGFELIRGRIEILGQRLEFTEGQATLVGDLDPFVNLTARARAGDTDVIVNVAGLVSDLEVTFSSQPELPQDEVLSLLIFERGTAELSPLQLARLASAASELAGGGSLVDGLRDAAGLDQLDIVTTEEGNAALQAGTYIQDNVYVSVQTDAEGDSRISIDLDITDNVKARGSTDSDGESSLGIFYEQDY